MAYIVCTRTDSHQYVRIMDTICLGNKKHKRTVVANLGELSKLDNGDPDFLSKLREQFASDGSITVNGKTYYNNRASHSYSFDVNFNTNIPFGSSVDFRNFGYLILENLFQSLGLQHFLAQTKSRSKINYNLLDIVRLLIFNRVLNPTSKMQAYETRMNYFSPLAEGAKLEDVYKTLTVLADNSAKIQRLIDKRIRSSSISRDDSLVYYDVTNYYFEIDYPDDDLCMVDERGEVILDEKTKKPIIVEPGLRKKGVSKEHRPEPIVQMGLFIDNHGIPVSYGLFPGNTQDKSTFRDMINQQKMKLSMNKRPNVNGRQGGSEQQASKVSTNPQRVIVVADGGMYADENLGLLCEAQHGYVLSKSLKPIWFAVPKGVEGRKRNRGEDGIYCRGYHAPEYPSYKEWAEDDNDYTIIRDSFGEVIYKYKSRLVTRTLDYIDKVTGKHVRKPIVEKEVLYWSKKFYERTMHEYDKYREYLEDCIDEPSKLRDRKTVTEKYVTTSYEDRKTGEKIRPKKVLQINEKRLQKNLEVAGYYLITTSEVDMEDKDIINHYHGLSRIENSFRVIKSDLEGRPVYVHTKEHIEAHFLICFIALTMMRLLQYRLLEANHKNTITSDKNVTNDKNAIISNNTTTSEFSGWSEGLSASRIQNTLNNFRVATSTNGVCLIDGKNDQLIELLEAIKVDYHLSAPLLPEVNQLKNRILKAPIL